MEHVLRGGCVGRVVVGQRRRGEVVRVRVRLAVVAVGKMERGDRRADLGVWPLVHVEHCPMERCKGRNSLVNAVSVIGQRPDGFCSPGPQRILRSA